MARKLNKRERLFLFSGGAALVLFFFFKLLFLPVVRFWSGAPERIEEQTDVLLAYQAVVAREESLKQEAGAIDKALTGLEGVLLPGETGPLAAAELQTEVKEIAEQAGLDIVSEKVLKQRDREYFVEIPFQIVATGSIENFRDFIALLESAETHIGISEVNFRSLGRRQPVRGGGRPKNKRGIQATMTVAGLVPAQDS
jgi:Tfp pilus assembly protein PilO